MPLAHKVSILVIDVFGVQSSTNREAVNILQPRVAAAATLGNVREKFATATRSRHLLQRSPHRRRNRFAVAGLIIFSFPRVAEAATLGWRT